MKTYTIKPLEWRDGSGGSEVAVANSCFGLYAVLDDAILGFCCIAGTTRISGKPSAGDIEGAKAICQADYEERIGGALVMSSWCQQYD